MKVCVGAGTPPRLPSRATAPDRPLDLDRLAGQQVVRHRRHHAPWAGVDQLHDLRRIVGAQPRLQRHADGHRLLHQRLQQRARLADWRGPGRSARASAPSWPESGASMANFIHSSRPMLGADVGVDAGTLAGLEEGAVRALGLPSASANSSAANLPICLMTPGSAMWAAMRATPGTTAAWPDDAADALGALHAVLEREDGRALGHQRSRLSAALSVSRILTAKMMASAAGISRASATTLTGFEVQLADARCRAAGRSRAWPPVRAARDERHVVAGGGQPAPK